MYKIWKTTKDIIVDDKAYPKNSLLIAGDVEMFYLLHKDESVADGDAIYIGPQDFSDVIDELGIKGISLIYSNES